MLTALIDVSYCDDSSTLFRLLVLILKGGTLVNLEKPAAPSVMTAIKILNMLKENGENAMTLSEIHRGLGLPKSTVLNVLKTLRQADFISLDPETKRYRLGWGIAVLGVSAAAGLNYLSVARSHLRPFSQQTGVACIVARRVRDEYVIVDSIEVAGYVSVAVPPGSSWPLHFGALGKVFLAYETPTELETYLAEHKLIQYTPYTITDMAELKKELARVRNEGLAVNIEEYTLGVNGVAAPVFGPDGKLALVISALDFASTLGSEKLEALGVGIKKVADAITITIGGRKFSAALS